MHHVRGVGRGQRIRNLAGDVQRERDRQPPLLLDRIAQALAFHEFEDQVERAIFQLTEVRGRRHVRVLDARGSDGLPFEPRHHLRQVCHLPVEHLDRDGLAHVHVLGAVHRPHAAGTQQAFHAVALGEHGADQRLLVGGVLLRGGATPHHSAGGRRSGLGGIGRGVRLGGAVGGGIAHGTNVGRLRPSLSSARELTSSRVRNRAAPATNARIC